MELQLSSFLFDLTALRCDFLLIIYFNYVLYLHVLLLVSVIFYSQS